MSETFTLDERIKRDLEELYNSGILTFIQQFQDCKIKEAEQLSMNLFGTPDKLSTHGLPNYYTGKRDANTVMVMLNPGSDVISQNNPFFTEKLLEKLGINTVSSDEFVNSFIDGCKNYGNLDLDDKGENKGKIRIDNFDIKQAAFLKAWNKSGVVISDPFPSKDDRDGLRKVKRNVLMEKLQLELIPYASSEFKTVKPDKYKYLFPYIETLFDEIFSHKRTYVIFCSDFFEKLFKKYSKEEGCSGTIEFGKKEKNEYILNGRNAYCTPIKITYTKGKTMTSIHAVIAHTFPNKALPNAYDKMQEYGKFCFNCYNKYKKLKP